jgi:hypothetical protein
MTGTNDGKHRPCPHVETLRNIKKTMAQSHRRKDNAIRCCYQFQLRFDPPGVPVS